MIFLLSSILMVSIADAQHMDLCEYYNKIKVLKPECMPQPRLQTNFQAAPPMRSHPVFLDQPVMPNFSALPLCRNYFHSCMSSSLCESGTVCTSSNAGSCCTNPAQSRCPSATSLNINCRKMRGVNWCSSDVDCHGKSTMPSVCCPTGCNYNMCIHVGVPQLHSVQRERLVFSSLMGEQSCPDPYTLDVKCNSPNPTSWCNTDAECPSGLHPRRCCRTLCGYNTCVVKYAGKWIIS